MLDNPEKTARLVAALKTAVPFESELTPEVVKQLQAEIANPDQTHRTVSDLYYAGDEGRHPMSHRPAEQRTCTVYLPHSRSNAPYDGARNGRCRLSEASSEEVEEAGSPIVIVLPTPERFSAMKRYGTANARA